MPKAKTPDPIAVELGRRGGKATAKKLTAKQRTANARKAANKRWEKVGK
jgi:hypothetical protein